MTCSPVDSLVADHLAQGGNTVPFFFSANRPPSVRFESAACEGITNNARVQKVSRYGDYFTFLILIPFRDSPSDGLRTCHISHYARRNKVNYFVILKDR